MQVWACAQHGQAVTYHYERIYDEVATVADRAAFLLEFGDEALTALRADLAELSQRLQTMQVDEGRRERLSRSIRSGRDGVDLWLQGTTAACELAAVEAPTDELRRRLLALSWAWGRLRLHEMDESKHADEALLARAAALTLKGTAAEASHEEPEVNATL